MDIALSASAAAIRTAGGVSPQWGAAIALPLFARIAKPRAVPADALPTMFKARRSTIRVPGMARAGVDVAGYEWGDGDRVVALAHGWDGRAGQFATLVRELVAEGYRVVAFDAPAHGETPGSGAYLVDWTDVLAALAERHTGLHAVVGHSFGGLAALVAAADGIAVDRIVTVAAPAEPDSLFAQFQAMLGLTAPVTAALRTRFATRYFPGEADPLTRLSPLRRPLPSGTGLLAVHDERDRMVPFAEHARIMRVNPGARALVTSGFGHNRILEVDPFLDAVIDFVSAPVVASRGAAADTPSSAASPGVVEAAGLTAAVRTASRPSPQPTLSPLSARSW